MMFLQIKMRLLLYDYKYPWEKKIPYYLVLKSYMDYT